MVKRKKYTEDLDIKITDDEDEQEDVDVTTTAAAVASISGGTAAQLKQEMELDVDGQPSMQFFVVRLKSNKRTSFMLKYEVATKRREIIDFTAVLIYSRFVLTGKPK